MHEGYVYYLASQDTCYLVSQNQDQILVICVKYLTIRPLFLYQNRPKN
jgi:hypothetical protein